MSSVILTLSFSLFTIMGLGQKKLYGTYQTNFSSYGMFGQTLTINCDNSVILNFRGDLMNDNSIGNWMAKRKLLTLTFDSTLYPYQRYKTKIMYRIKRNRLYLIQITRRQFQGLKEQIEKYSEDNANTLKLSSYRKFKKKYFRTSKDFSGNTGVQYLKKIKSTDCNRRNLL
jgi:hypothetical protein